MKKIISILGVLFVIGVVFYAFNNTADAPVDQPSATSSPAELSAPEDGQYSVAASSSEVTWRAERPLIDGYVDLGFVPISGGDIALENGDITAGEVRFDVSGIEATTVSNQGAGASALTGHLRSEDFLAVETYPTATFMLTNATEISEEEDAGANNYRLTGDLTLRGETAEITFPAQVGMNDAGQLAVSGEATIDRTRWNIRYGSDSFFDNLGNDLIADEVMVQIELLAESVR